MKHVNLDVQEESVKRFVLGLTADGGGSLLEFNGKPVACVVPAPKPARRKPASVTWTDQKNARRSELIDKEIDDVLTPEEAVELRLLQDEMLRDQNKVCALADQGGAGAAPEIAQEGGQGAGRRRRMTPFVYPSRPHVRRHGPQGYADYGRFLPWLRDEFSFRCVYCLRREQWGRAAGELQIDHFLAICHRPELKASYDNLLLVCPICNLLKGSLALPDPCRVLTSDAVQVDENGTIRAGGARPVGLSAAWDWTNGRLPNFASCGTASPPWHTASIRNSGGKSWAIPRIYRICVD